MISLFVYQWKGYSKTRYPQTVLLRNSSRSIESCLSMFIQTNPDVFCVFINSEEHLQRRIPGLDVRGLLTNAQT